MTAIDCNVWYLCNADYKTGYENGFKDGLQKAIRDIREAKIAAGKNEELDRIIENLNG